MPGGNEAERTDRVLTALDASTRVTTEVIGHLKGVDRELDSVKKSQDKGFEAVRDEMRSTAAHLDNLIRETVVTNTILQEDMASRQSLEAERREAEREEREWRRKIEEDEREWRRTVEDRQLNRKEKVEDDTRGFIRKMAEEAWGIFKQPLAYLVMGLIFWFLITRLNVNPQAVMVQPSPVPVPGVNHE